MSNICSNSPSCEDDVCRCDEEITLENFKDHLTAKQDAIVMEWFGKNVLEIGGRPVTKDNFEDMFESWFEDATMQDIQDALIEKEEEDLSGAEANAIHAK